MNRGALHVFALALAAGSAACDADGSSDASSTAGTRADGGLAGASSSGGGTRPSGGDTSGRGGQATGGAAPSSAGAPTACPTTQPLSGGMQRCSSNASGNVAGGYTWTIWSSGSGGCMTPYGVGAAFKANWNNSGDFLARVGLSLGSSKTFDQWGTLTADFAEVKAGSAGGFSYIGIYGWSVDPLHEYYIIDDWFGSRPNPGTKVGTVALDGGTYDILTHTQQNQPSITGSNATFVQFWSLRQTARSCGQISITEHFEAWAALGMNLGKMVEAKVLVEAGGGVGSIDFTSASITAQ